MTIIRYTAGGDYDAANSVDVTPAYVDPLFALSARDEFFKAFNQNEYYTLVVRTYADGIYADFSDAVGRPGGLLEGGSFGDVLIGTTSTVNILEGNGGNDLLVGGAQGGFFEGGDGNDVMQGGRGGQDVDHFDGGDGFDTVSYANASTAVTFDQFTGTYTGDAQGDTLTSIEALIGSAFDDTFIVTSRFTIEGGVGADTIVSFANGSRASYAHSAAAVNVDLAFGTASGGDAEGDTLVGLTGLIGSVFADTLTGGLSVANRLSGNGGLDTITGGNLNDTVIVTGAWAFADGGAGEDRLVVRGTAGEQIALSDVTFSNFERLVVRDGVHLDLSALTAPVDTIRILGPGGSVVGTAFKDHIAGGSGDDTIIGGGGVDILHGGGGSDTFVFESVSDSNVDAFDRISLFSGSLGDRDRLDVSALGFTSLHDGDFTGSGVAELRVIDKGNGNFVVVGDADGNGVADFKVRMLGPDPLTADDFVFAPTSETPGVETALPALAHTHFVMRHFDLMPSLEHLALA